MLHNSNVISRGKFGTNGDNPRQWHGPQGRGYNGNERSERKLRICFGLSYSFEVERALGACC